MTIASPLDGNIVTVIAKRLGHSTKVPWCPCNNYIVGECRRVADTIRASIYIPTLKKRCYSRNTPSQKWLSKPSRDAAL